MTKEILEQISQEIHTNIKGGVGYLGQAQEAFRTIQGDISNLGQFPDQKTFQLEIDPATGQPLGPARELFTLGLLRRIKGR